MARGAQRVCVIGLDGTPASLLRQLIGAGELPALAALCSEGVGDALAPFPPVSAVSWASATTGVNPGRHGVFGFVDLRPGTFELSFTTAESVRAVRAWDRAAEFGLESLVVNVPGTYPALPMRGRLVAGFVSPVLERATWPRQLAGELRKLNYVVDVDLSVGHTDLSAFVDSLFAAHAARRAAIRRLMRGTEWDLAYIAFTGTDRLHHFLWAQAEDGVEPWAGAFLRYYRAVDDAVAELVELLPRETEIVLMSDHGFCRLDQEVFVNRLLERDGWLVLNSPGNQLSQLDSNRTRAYALDPARIYVNVRGRGPDSSVDPADRPRVVEELHSWATAVPWVEYAIRREEAFEGSELHKAPDLVLVPKRGFDPKATLREASTEARSSFTGMHTRDDAFVVFSGRRPLNAPVQIESVAVTALRLLGIPTEELDGTDLGQTR